MNDESVYIATPHSKQRPIRIDAILEKRMQEFMLARKCRVWREGGDR